MSEEIGFPNASPKNIYIDKEHVDWTVQVMFIYLEIYDIYKTICTVSICKQFKKQVLNWETAKMYIKGVEEKKKRVKNNAILQYNLKK